MYPIIKELGVYQALLFCSLNASLRTQRKLYPSCGRISGIQPIANFQLIQAKLADIYTDLEAARLMAHRSLWLAQQGKRVSFAWVNAIEVILQVSPRYQGSRLYKLLLQQMFAWGEERQRVALEGHFKRVPSFCAFEDDYSLIDFFKRHGFERSEFYIQLV